MNEKLADDGLARWISGIRSQPAGKPPLDVNKLRAARARQPGPRLAQVVDLTTPGDNPVHLRFYRPDGRPLQLIAYVHGGAFIFGDLDSHDRTCRRLAVEANAAVLAVHYRRAPEHPAPAAIDDVVAALKWAIRTPAILGSINGSPSLAGDSAGGPIALLAAQRLVAGLVHGFLSLDTESPAALEAGNNLLRQFGSVIRDDWSPARSQRK